MKKSNIGFTLVETIVVIVILAIITGVSIGGIYRYVGQSRVNTDINNLATMEETLANIGTDEELLYLIEDEHIEEVYYISWVNKIENNYIGSSDEKSFINVDSSVRTAGIPSKKYINKTENIILASTMSTNSNNIISLSNKSSKVRVTGDLNKEIENRITQYASEIFTDGLVGSKSGREFKLYVDICDDIITVYSNLYDPSYSNKDTDGDLIPDVLDSDELNDYGLDIWSSTNVFDYLFSEIPDENLLNHLSGYDKDELPTIKAMGAKLYNYLQIGDYSVNGSTSKYKCVTKIDGSHVPCGLYTYLIPFETTDVEDVRVAIWIADKNQYEIKRLDEVFEVKKN